MKCPECGKELGESTWCDISTISWSCGDCGKKIYKTTND